MKVEVAVPTGPYGFLQRTAEESCAEVAVFNRLHPAPLARSGSLKWRLQVGAIKSKPISQPFQS